MEVAGDGADDALALFESGSPEEGELILTGSEGLFASVCGVNGTRCRQNWDWRLLGECGRQYLHSAICNVI